MSQGVRKQYLPTNVFQITVAPYRLYAYYLIHLIINKIVI